MSRQQHLSQLQQHSLTPVIHQQHLAAASGRGQNIALSPTPLSSSTQGSSAWSPARQAPHLLVQLLPLLNAQRPVAFLDGLAVHRPAGPGQLLLHAGQLLLVEHQPGVGLRGRGRGWRQGVASGVVRRSGTHTACRARGVVMRSKVLISSVHCTCKHAEGVAGSCTQAEPTSSATCIQPADDSLPFTVQHAAQQHSSTRPASPSWAR